MNFADEEWDQELLYFNISPPTERPPSAAEVENVKRQNGKPTGPPWRVEMWNVFEDSPNEVTMMPFCIDSKLFVIQKKAFV